MRTIYQNTLLSASPLLYSTNCSVFSQSLFTFIVRKKLFTNLKTVWFWIDIFAVSEE